MNQSTTPDENYDVIVVGAGFAGLYLLYRLREMGFKVHVFDAAGGVGGTWYWNRYPGARCDVESIEYSYSFSEELEQEWEWTERFAAQPEILSYLEHVAERFDLYPDMTFNTRVQSAHFDEANSVWEVTTEARTYRVRYCIMATGCLSSTNLPDFAGLDDYRGHTYHTGRWPHAGVDFGGQRVGVIGTGSSGIQAIPIIAQQAAHLTVFQRTPNWSMPACNAPLSEESLAKVKAEYQAFRERQRRLGVACHYPPRKESALAAAPEQREKVYEQWWHIGGLSFLGAFNDIVFDAEANATAAEFIENKIRNIVNDPALAAKLIPDHPVGCKRPCSDTQYYETFNCDNVSLVDVRESPIERFTQAGCENERC